MDRTKGFTIIEVIFVIVIATALTGISVNAFGSVQQRLAVKQGRNAFVSLHARARAQAIEFGQDTRLLLSTTGDSIWVTRNDTTLEKIRLRAEHGVDIQGPASAYRLCMNARGYGDEGCNSFDKTVTLRFVARNGTDTAAVDMLPLGQLIY